MKAEENLNLEAELKEINPFTTAMKSPNKSIITRLLLYAVVLCVLTILVNIYAPLDTRQLFSEVEDAEMTEILKEVEENETLKRFQAVIQGFVSFFAPIVFVLLTGVGLKLLTLIFRPLFKEKVSIQKLLVIGALSYAMLFIGSVVRLVFSIIKKEFMLYSLGSLPHYITSLATAKFPLNIIANIELFTIFYCGFLALGLASLTKIRLLPSIILIFGCYLGYILLYSFLLG